MNTHELKKKLFIIIFGSDTPAGRAFDVGLLITILLSMLAVSLESVQFIKEEYGTAIRVFEWIITILFTIEYILRIYCTPRRMRYVLSFYGIVDLLSILPTYLSIFIGGSHYVTVVRGLRLLRVFRVLKLTHFLGEAYVLREALKRSMVKITVFLGTVLVLVFIIGAIMYLVEGPGNGFTSIPISIYWAIVTLTTVGYGDITPQTVIGQIISSLVMILGYGIIAVPTGIVSVELSKAEKRHDVHPLSKNSKEIANGYCNPCHEKIRILTTYRQHLR